MSIEKVRRFELESKQFGFGAECFAVESNDGRYVKYAEVENLVEAVETLLFELTVGKTIARDEVINNARNELARWTL